MECAPPPDRGHLLPLVIHRWWVIAAFAVLVLAAAPGLLRLEIDNSPEGFFVRDAAALERFRQLEGAFTRDRGVRIVLSGPGLWTERGLAFLAALEERSQEEIQGVLGAAGPYRHHRWRLPSWPPADPRAFGAEVAADPIDRAAGWVSADGSTVTVLVGLSRLTPDRRRATLAELEELLTGAPPGVEARLAGLAVINHALDEALVRMAARFFPALLAVAVLLLAAVFRSPSGVLLPLGTVAVCESVVLGAMGHAGQRLDLVVILLVPLLFVIALATAVHVLAYHRKLRAESSPDRSPGRDPVSTVLATYRVKAWPVLWTGVTTAVGFGSLAVSDVPPVRALGLWSAFGIVFVTLTMLALYPALLAALPALRSRDEGPGGPAARTIELRAGALGRKLAGAAIARHRAVALLFALLAVGAGAGLLRLRIETDVLAYFREDSAVRAEITALEAEGIGTVAASLVLRGDGLRLDTPEALRRQAELTARLGREPLVLGALSAGDLVADVARRSTRPGGDGRIEGTGGVGDPGAASLARAEARIRREPDLERMLAYLLTDDGARTRITLLVPMRGYEELSPLFDRIRAEARRLFPDTEVGITGQYPLVLAAQRTLLRTMVLSLTLTALGVAIVLRLLLGSLALAARALVPNLWPVLFVLGVMGWWGLPVDSATVMVASVALGLAVDDTLHSLGSFRRFLGSRSPEPSGRGAGRPRPAESARATLGETAGAHALTSMILTVGFGVVGLCELVPVARFGALAAVAVAVALVADLTLVPTLLARAPERALARLVNRNRAALRRPRGAG